MPTLFKHFATPKQEDTVVTTIRQGYGDIICIYMISCNDDLRHCLVFVHVINILGSSYRPEIPFVLHVVLVITNYALSSCPFPFKFHRHSL